MNSDDKFEYWFDIAKYDLETAIAMFGSKRWLYVVFMCQQSIEKITKALYTIYVDDSVPRVHNISYIISKYLEKLPNTISEEQFLFYDRLTAYYIQGRYPEYKEKLSTMVNQEEANKILKQTKEEFECLVKMKK